VDTVIYSEEKLGAKPVLVSIPDAGDDDRMKYPNMEVPVWVVIEKDGSVSRAESRATTANAGLERVVLSMVRQAQFNPGTRAGNAVRVGKIIVVKIKALKQKDD
jgi:TonB family protein